MPTYVELDDSNCVVSAGHSKAMPEGAFALPDLPDGQLWDLGALTGAYMVEGELQPRPSIAPEVNGSEITIPPLPIGTTVMVFEQFTPEALLNITTEAEGWTETIHLPDAGRYSVDICPPPPFVSTSTSLEVSA